MKDADIRAMLIASGNLRTFKRRTETAIKKAEKAARNAGRPLTVADDAALQAAVRNNKKRK